MSKMEFYFDRLRYANFYSIKLSFSYPYIKLVSGAKRTISFEYPQHMIWLRNNNISECTTFIWRPGFVALH